MSAAFIPADLDFEPADSMASLTDGLDCTSFEGDDALGAEKTRSADANGSFDLVLRNDGSCAGRWGK